MTNGIENEALKKEHPKSNNAPTMDITRLTSTSPTLFVKWTNSFIASDIAKAKKRAKL